MYNNRGMLRKIAQISDFQTHLNASDCIFSQCIRVPAIASEIAVLELSCRTPPRIVAAAAAAGTTFEP